MVRKVTPAQYRSMLRQQQQKQKQAINKHNQNVRKYNADVKRQVQRQNQEIRKHNQAVRTYNNRLRTYKNKLSNELRKLAHQSNTSSYVTVRTSVKTVTDSFEYLDGQSQAADTHPFYNELVDLSEQEAANSVGALNALLGEPSEVDESDFVDADVGEFADFLSSISEDAHDRWKGAIFALNPQNPDAARHFCTSAREVITQILDVRAPDKDVLILLPDCQVQTGNRKPTRSSKIQYFLSKKGILEEAMEDFVDNDIDDVLSLFRTFNDGTHGSAGKFNLTQLQIIRQRVEGAIVYLSKIAS